MMARIQRLFMPGMPLHVVQRGADRQICFFEPADFLWYLQQLQRHSHAQSCLLHAYVLMTNHVHLLLSAGSVLAVSRMMKALGQEYAHYINWRHHRSGPHGTGATNPVSCRLKPISWCASAISNSIPCEPAWCAIRGTTDGPAIVAMRRGARML
ncbi:hypothetical protein CSQ90_04450 [Janthinobacterium sp. BJB303]|nr:hypothetical protein CSQ90_04450 [Janthinobacterium sp. BJB303]